MEISASVSFENPPKEYRDHSGESLLCPRCVPDLISGDKENKPVTSSGKSNVPSLSVAT